MILFEQLSKSNRNVLSELLSNYREFNELNNDFFKMYPHLDLMKILKLKKRVFLIKNNDQYIGFIWVEYLDFKTYKIQSLYFKDEEELSFEDMKRYFSSGDIFLYECRLNRFNKPLLEEIGFVNNNHYIEMKLDIQGYEGQNKQDYNLSFPKFIEGKDERLRCMVQNDIFKSDRRTPLIIKDIFNDEDQDYYIKGGGFFISYDKIIIGYGQLISHDYEGSGLLVNFGIKEEYRNKGYGQKLLDHIIKEGKKLNFSCIYLRVSSSNISAINLYSYFGFKTFSNVIQYEYRIK